MSFVFRSPDKRLGIRVVLVNILTLLAGERGNAYRIVYGHGTGTDQLKTITIGGDSVTDIRLYRRRQDHQPRPGTQTHGGQVITSLTYNNDARVAAINSGKKAFACYTYDGFGQRFTILDK